MINFLSGYKGFLGQEINKRIKDITPLKYNRFTQSKYPELDNLKENFQVVHSGASSARNNIGKEIYLDNYFSVVELVNRVSRVRDGRIIFLSANSIKESITGSLCTDLYSHLKLESEKLIINSLPPERYAIIRLPGIYTKHRLGQGIIDRIANANSNQSILTINGNQEFNNMAISGDIAAFIMKLLNRTILPGHIGEIKTKDSISLSNIFHLLKKWRPNIIDKCRVVENTKNEDIRPCSTIASKLGYTQRATIELLYHLYEP